MGKGRIACQMFFRSVLTTYLQESRFAVGKYNALSMINGLPYDRHAEIVAAELF